MRSHTVRLSDFLRSSLKKREVPDSLFVRRHFFAPPPRAKKWVDQEILVPFGTTGQHFHWATFVTKTTIGTTIRTTIGCSRCRAAATTTTTTTTTTKRVFKGNKSQGPRPSRPWCRCRCSPSPSSTPWCSPRSTTSSSSGPSRPWCRCRCSPSPPWCSPRSATSSSSGPSGPRGHDGYDGCDGYVR